VQNTIGRKQSASCYDLVLISVSIFLAMTGLVMVASSSISIAENLHANPLYYFWRQSFSVVAGFCIAIFILNTPLFIWEKLDTYFC